MARTDIQSTLSQGTGVVLFGKQQKTPIIKTEKNRYYLEIELDEEDQQWVRENVDKIKKHYKEQIKAKGAARSRAERQGRELLKRSDAVEKELRQLYSHQRDVKNRLAKESSKLATRCEKEMMKQTESAEQEKNLKDSIKVLKQLEDNVQDSSDDTISDSE